ncbi:MAG: hypothetical protein VR70_16365 [Rhodospirillaceae bacterium BRH_c57]|nr:MAG: hypothetical protein VR70_16365 [Rhodospirillaceae bacterium BRH_c57]
MRRPWAIKSTRRTGAVGVIVAACAGLLGACAETTLAVHTAKTLSGPSASAGADQIGSYKVGKPYQIAGTWYYPKEEYAYREEGMASWYGPGFHGKMTANGEPYDQNAMTAAHRTLPMPSMVRVTNLDNGRSLVLRINDRGPFAKNRIIDISQRGAQLLGFVNQGTARVRVEVMAEESMALKSAALRGQPAEMPAIVAAPRASVQAVALDAPRLQAPAVLQASTTLQVPAVVAPVSMIHAAGLGGGAGMYVQAGAFSSEDNVRRLESQLNGVAPVIVTPIEIDGRQLLRVRLGPLGSAADADRVLAAVQAQGLPGARLVQD